MRRSEVLAEESILCLQKALTHLREIWELIGIPEEQRLQRTEVVNKHIKDLLDRMIAEEESLRERLLKSISICKKELNTLCSELQVEPFHEERETTVLQLEKTLRTQVELMRKQKKERKQELKLLQEQDQELREILCMPPCDVDSTSVPTLEELTLFRQHVATLRETKESRHEQFVSLKKQIILCMEELEHTPDTSFERDVVCEDESAFCLSLENIATLQKLLQQLEMKKSQNEAECEALRAQIRELWDRLQIPEEEREPVTAFMTGSKAKIRNALQLEVDRLEELKMQNIKQVIETIRVELAQFWDLCFYSQEQRQAFAPYYSEDYTENLLHLHDTEVIRLKNYYEVHKELFEGVQKWEDSWKLFLEFEKKASDPSRFTNRGGNLLKEEKERAKLQKTLPKLEEELKARIEKWEQEQSTAFVVNGQKFMEYVTEQWELHRLEKEKAKQERQLKNKIQTETEMLFGSAPRTPSKRPGFTPNKSGKVRKMNTTTMSTATPNNSIRPVFGTVPRSPVSRLPPSGSKSVVTSMYSGKKTPRAAQLRANKENMDLNGSILSGGYSGSTPRQHNCSIKSVASTYSEFSKDPSLSDSSTVGLQRELSKASRCDATARILNSTNIQS
ncbi:protein regulator of cytokinesis 1 isoform X1 [Meriones unguiculatus]|uniref:protein regulator of cytokinesis 1 isoform X1 n=1 Tax=Meriones unguiculatus TaxID=10047 RepID=UPI000B4F37B2|nr:protein regulator of cytokinesis 1 isoform X1 [Meriones unguiculatus]XP_021500966.1 protein regulator of cytokinesis 1 isoform X1 [Meriones unguiculatus]